ncbi:MAG: Flagellar protein FlgJ [Firmicutes bacterium]|nr:Flagellar protein FlgJ [Bacillota bacterium]
MELTNRIQTLGQEKTALKPNKNAKDEKLKESCREMEAVFLNMLLQQMRRTVPKSGIMDKSNAEETMQSMLDGEVTQNMSKAGGMGLADLLYRQLSEQGNIHKSQAPK